MRELRYPTLPGKYFNEKAGWIVKAERTPTPRMRTVFDRRGTRQGSQALQISNTVHTQTKTDETRMAAALNAVHIRRSTGTTKVQAIGNATDRDQSEISQKGFGSIQVRPLEYQVRDRLRLNGRVRVSTWLFTAQGDWSVVYCHFSSRLWD
ncbi:hypothetical protein NBRC116187_30380 [Halopseudomonas sabulinigri]|uniref:Uncharacterized protein n=1 Tax=Halopseudomonas sabulinigri TaxID=472181 RepID=A0ABP9ZT88_9GAMM